MNYVSKICTFQITYIKSGIDNNIIVPKLNEVNKTVIK